MKIRISTTIWEPIKRQAPEVWRGQGIEVLINEQAEDCDVWVVYQGLYRPEETVVPPERIFFFGYEPPGLHDYQERFLAQFSKVVTCDPQIGHPGVIRRHQCQPWLAGIKRHATEMCCDVFGVNWSYDDFKQMPVPAKVRRLSAICSKKVMVAGHEARLRFVDVLQKKIGDGVDVFGYGFEPIVDKWDALAGYDYHLVLENTCLADYWTEKLADAFLAWCVPIVWGCPNLCDYFPEDSFVALDPSDSDASLARVIETISQPPNEKQKLAVAEARRRVLDEYNLLFEIRRLAEATPAGEGRRIRLKDERLFLPGGSLRPLLRAVLNRR